MNKSIDKCSRDKPVEVRYVNSGSKGIVEKPIRLHDTKLPEKL